MANRNNAPGSNNDTRADKDIKASGSPDASGRTDLQDSDSDIERLKADSSTIDLPEVKDIPGQEHITSAGIPSEMRDTTISSDDEEGLTDGKDVLKAEDDELEIVMGTEADVTEEDLILLGDPDKDMDGGDDEEIAMEGLDDTDFEGEPLNEAAADTDSTGEDLDMPAEEGRDLSESMGQGDEENDYYSLGSDDNDNTAEGTP